MKRVLFVVVAVVTLVGLALPAGAHSEEELAEFLESYQRLRGNIPAAALPGDRVEVESILDEVLAGWKERHPCSKVLETWEEERCSRPARVHADSSGRSSGRSSGGYSGMGSNVEQWRGLVAVYFPASEVDRALCIMGHESGGNPSADNPRSTAAGLFQFLRGTWDSIPSSVRGGSYDSGAVYDPALNVAAAAWLVAADGWHHWSPWNRGLCR